VCYVLGATAQGVVEGGGESSSQSGDSSGRG